MNIIPTPFLSVRSFRRDQWFSLRWIKLGVFGLLFILLGSGVWGCGEDPCVAGTQCAMTCPGGQIPVCVVDGICECVVYGNGGGSNPSGGLSPITGGETTGGTQTPIEVPSCAPPLPGDLILNEILVDPSLAEPQNEFIELVNTSNQEVNLQGLYINYNGELKFDFLAGCMAPNSAVALYHEQSLTQWSTPARAPTWTVNGRRVFTNSADFTIDLYQNGDGNPLSVLFGTKSLVRAGVSANRPTDLQGDEAIRHTEISEQDQSPALCSNGGTFENQCLDGVSTPIGGQEGGMMVGGQEGAVMNGGQEGGQTGAMLNGGQEGGQEGAMMSGGQEGGVMPVPVNCAPPSPGVLFINEVLINPEGNETTTKEEFIEFVNQGPNSINLGGIGLYYNGDWKFDFPQGCFAGESLLALFNQKGPTQWIWSSSDSDSARFATASIPSFALRNSSGITLELKDAQGNLLTSFSSDNARLDNPEARIVEGQSLTRTSDGNPNEVFYLHPLLNTGESFSPGRCQNGNRYETGCLSP